MHHLKGLTPAPRRLQGAHQRLQRGGRNTTNSTTPRTASKRFNNGRATIRYPTSPGPAGREITINTRNRCPPTGNACPICALGRLRLTAAASNATGEGCFDQMARASPVKIAVSRCRRSISTQSS
jgi:hypothetical protein